MSALRRGLALAFGVTVSATAPASAHLMNTGFGLFYDGLTHLFVTPEDLLPVVALALLAGLHGPRPGRIVLFALPAAWLAGGVAGLLVAPHVTLPVAPAVATVAAGALVAAGRPVPVAWVAGFAVALGALAGVLNGSELATANASPLGMAGIVTALFVVVSIFAGQAASVRAAWARVTVQVAGSWIAAIGLLMLGWAVRGR